MRCGILIRRAPEAVRFRWLKEFDVRDMFGCKCLFRLVEVVGMRKGMMCICTDIDLRETPARLYDVIDLL